MPSIEEAMTPVEYLVIALKVRSVGRKAMPAVACNHVLVPYRRDLVKTFAHGNFQFATFVWCIQNRYLTTRLRSRIITPRSSNSCSLRYHRSWYLATFSCPRGRIPRRRK